MTFRPAKTNAFEDRAAAEATLWVASAFRGRAVYDRREAASLAEVLAAASELYDGSRNVLIYACAPNGAQAMVGTWVPD